MRSLLLVGVLCLQAFFTTCGGADVSNGFNSSLPWKPYTVLKVCLLPAQFAQCSADGSFAGHHYTAVLRLAAFP